jgi:hypothetical protein
MRRVRYRWELHLVDVCNVRFNLADLLHDTFDKASLVFEVLSLLIVHCLYYPLELLHLKLGLSVGFLKKQLE